MVLVLLGMMFLFLKFDLTFLDSSLIYIMTNLFGLLLLKLGLDEIESGNGQELNDQLWFYGVMNVLLLTCRFFGVEMHGIGLEYFESYILAFTLLFAHFYVFFYPLYIFYVLLRFDTRQLERPISFSTNYMVPICLVLATISVLNYTDGLIRSLIWTTIITLELHASVRLFIVNKTSFTSDFLIGGRLSRVFKKTL